MNKIYLKQQSILINGDSLTLDEFWHISVNGALVALHPDVQQRVGKSRKIIEDILKEERSVYGVTTGFGKFKDQFIPLEETRRLQKNLILSHACGVGEPFPSEVVRGMLLLRLNNLAKGYSGIRYEVLLLLMALLNKHIEPIVPACGSVGASGDLAPLAHLVLPLIGEGEVRIDGKLCEAKEALSRFNLTPVTLEPKEGLALINGTQAMTSLGALALTRGQRLLIASDIAGAMTLEALMGSRRAFKKEIQEVRPHPGQIVTARNLEQLLAGSSLMESHKDCGRVQDAYSLRCIPQVHGAVKDALRAVSNVVNIELNAVTDNPLIFPGIDDTGFPEVISGGNFHGHPISLHCDFLRAAITSLANISERRTDRMLNPATSDLPAFLVKEGGVNSGFMIPQYVQASLVSECKILSSPCSVDSIPTSAYQEDFVTMGTTSARFALQVVEHAERVIAIEMLVAAQALDFRRPLTFGKGTEAAYKAIRSHIPFLEQDRYMKPDIDKITELVMNGIIQQAVCEAVNALAY